jgi:hypothetical protein
MDHYAQHNRYSKSSLFTVLFCFVVLGFDIRASYLLGNSSTT